ncbi:hypothetical protein FQR65_LT17217 [Abscondita terminalis]|nr:hypothetical protein FQR65_LT17217 [Abscondita terminalis]
MAKYLSQWQSEGKPETPASLTKESSNDFQLHIEWRSPLTVKGKGQGRGNSGIFLQGLYEIQVLDNNDNPTYVNGQAGSIYKQRPPLVESRVEAEKDGRTERGSAGHGGRDSYSKFISEKKWKEVANQALEQALVNLEAIPTPAGEMTVVLGPGWPGILLHEAVGHGLEGDFNRKKVSAFSNSVGKQVAASDITVVDDWNSA